MHRPKLLKPFGVIYSRPLTNVKRWCMPTYQAASQKMSPQQCECRRAIFGRCLANDVLLPGKELAQLLLDGLQRSSCTMNSNSFRAAFIFSEESFRVFAKTGGPAVSLKRYILGLLSFLFKILGRNKFGNPCNRTSY
ncbi:hypothetical protein AVEN_23869-1 [Araneus ventricosus]|uniref:Uncharacterized protein n=1 Tax=Araneus ventricosus TaxID=182803 RepID=A0A4Y2FGD4_ARAVE|nr:hypothetical protein AVEN_23869-1 [Araneus ventricosus]